MACLETIQRSTRTTVHLISSFGSQSQARVAHRSANLHSKSDIYSVLKFPVKTHADEFRRPPATDVAGVLDELKIGAQYHTLERLEAVEHLKKPLTTIVQGAISQDGSLPPAAR